MAQGKKTLTPEEIQAEATKLEQVKVLSGMNCSHAEIAAVIQCNERTIRRKYARAVEEGRLNGKASLKRRMWQCAMGRIEKKVVLVKIKRETRKPDGTIEKYETQEPRTIDHYVEGNAGMMEFLAKHMLGYKDTAASETSDPDKSDIVIKYVLVGADGKESQANPEEIAKAHGDGYDQGG